MLPPRGLVQECDVSSMDIAGQGWTREYAPLAAGGPPARSLTLVEFPALFGREETKCVGAHGAQ